ncbi:MAG: PhoH family protein [Candidatus Eisenbacteria bacterium]|nr:PhoH family protein [Candidatus Eisenbacteria bacterium]
MTEELTQRLSIEDIEPLHLLGREDSNLRLLEERFKARIVVRNGFITLTGPEDEVKTLARALHELVSLAREGRMLEEPEVLYAIESARGRTQRSGAVPEGGEGPEAPGRHAARARPERIVYHLERISVSAKSPGQAAYLAAIEEHDVVFSIGPAGTGKTYLAVAAAVHALKAKTVDRILLVRPAVEAGESLGFLPGDYQDKVNPYMRPLHDALREMLSFERTRRLVELGVIEIVPLAYMRGRTLSNSFVILDEGQNTTLGQMKMFLTRLGANSKAVVTGDITQVDLTDKTQSGLILVQDILSGIKGIKFVYLTEHDVVRHRLVKAIIRAFEEREKRG